MDKIPHYIYTVYSIHILYNILYKVVYSVYYSYPYKIKMDGKWFVNSLFKIQSRDKDEQGYS